MGKSKKPAKFEVKGFIKGLRSLLDALPSESQKQNLNDAFTELIGFLTDLQNLLLAMPSTEDVSQLRQLLPKLEEFYASAKKVPAIAASVGVGNGSKKQKVNARKTKKGGIDAKQVLANLSKLPADEIRSRLEDKTFSKPALQALALELGMKPASNATKKSLADKIASDILNQRMRDGLAGRSNREQSVN